MERKPLRQSETISASQFLRMALLASTAFSPFVLAVAAQAQTQPAPYTTPQGGVVSAGSASIAQAPGSTTVTQTSQRAALDWQSFNVGAQAQVQFVQPSASAIALNRVVSPDPSVIAGRINANGQLVLINQSGVVFTQGSQVNAESVVVSTSNVANKDFMAGHLIFSEPPNPGAKIINDGNITARDAGLVGLVAPQVANNGVITATLGQVVLAGATAFTLDLYGDRLISLDVTKAVTAVDVGGKLVPALVTNSGVIVADGGHITLTAQDADALVTQLIDAGGTLQADSMGSQTGTISIEGVGGNIEIAGNLLARGTAAGTKGGAVEALTSGTVSVASSAVVDASGDAGGGVIAIGTDLTRAETGQSDTTAPKAAAVSIAAGSVLKADATGSGNGGKVTLLSSQNTGFGGTISVQGGPNGGNGGLAEISSDGVVELGGSATATAAVGQSGEILLDPQILDIVASPPNPLPGGSDVLPGSTSPVTADANPSYVTNASVNQLDGNVVLSATDQILVQAAIAMTKPNTSLTLMTTGSPADALPGSNGIDIEADITVEAAGVTGPVTIDAQNGPISINALITASDVTLESPGDITETGAGAISASELDSGSTQIGGAVLLSGANSIGQIGPGGFNANGDITINDTEALTVNTPIVAPNIWITDSANATDAITLNAALDTRPSAEAEPTGDVSLATKYGNVIENADGVIYANILAGSVAGSALLTNPGNGTPTDPSNEINNIGYVGPSGGVAQIPAQTGFTAKADFALQDQNALTVEDAGVGASNIWLSDTANATNAITLNAALDTRSNPAGSGEVSLATTVGNVIESKDGGVIYANILGGSVAGSALLTNPGNGTPTDPSNEINNIGYVRPSGGVAQIPAQTGFTAKGDFALQDQNALTVNDAVKAPNIWLADTANATDAITLKAALDTRSNPAGSGEVSLATTVGNVIETKDEGIIYANILAGSTGGAALLTNPGITGNLAEPSNEINEIGLAGASDLVTGVAQIGQQNGFTAKADFALQDQNALTVNGAVKAQDITLVDSAAATSPATDGITIDAGLTATAATGIVSLTAKHDSISEGANGYIVTTGSLTGSSNGDATFNNTANNKVGNLGSFSATGGDFTLDDNEGFNITGKVDAGNVTLNSGGTIAETTGYIVTTGSLTGSSGGNATFNNTANNAVGNLGAFTVTTGDFTLNDNEGFNVTGKVDAGNVTLNSGGTIAETTGYIVTTGSLTGTSIGDVLLTSTLNNIGTLGSFSSDGDFYLNNGAHSLDVVGMVTAGGNLGLEAATLSLNNTITAFGTVNPGPTNQGPTLSLLADTMDVTAGLQPPLVVAHDGFIEIAPYSSDNAIDLGSGTPGGGLSIPQSVIAVLDPTAELVVGEASFPPPPGGGGGTSHRPARINIGNAVIPGHELVLSAGTIVDYGTLIVDAGTGTLAFDSNGFSQTGTGALELGLLESDGPLIGGSVVLTGTLNSIAMLGSLETGISAPGTYDLALTDDVSLAVTGPVTARDITLIDNAASATNTITIDGALTATGTMGTPGTINLVADALTDTGSAITAEKKGLVAIAPFSGTLVNIDLGGTTSGELSLDSTLISLISAAVLQIGTAAGYAGGTIIADGSLGIGLTTLGPQTLVLSGTDIVFDSTLSVGTLAGSLATGLLSLASTGDIAETINAGLDIGTLTGTATTGSISLIGDANSIATVTSLSDLEGNISLSNVPTLTIAGLISTGTSADNELALEGSNFTEVAGGAIVAPTLVSFGTNVSGSVFFDNATNHINDIGPFELTGTGILTLRDQDPLTVDVGGIGDGGTAGGEGVNLIAPGITIDGPIGAYGVGLYSTGGITEDMLFGAIDANYITGTDSGGDVVLLGGNSITNLRSFAVPSNNFSLNDEIALFINAGTSIGVNSIDIGGLVMVGHENTITLEDAGFGITETSGGTLVGDVLNSGGTTIGGDVFLTNANSIATLGSFFAAGSIFLDNGPALLVDGLVSAGTTLALEGSNFTEVSGGAIQAPTLISFGTNVSGSVLFDNASNYISGLGPFSAGPELILRDAERLGVGGVGAGYVRLSAPGIDIDGPIDAGTVGLQSTAGITEPGGLIDANYLTGTDSGGDVVLLGRNAVTNLGNFSASGDNFSLNDTSNLDIAGPVAAGGNLLLADTGNLNIPGQVTAGGNLLMTDNGNLDMTGQLRGTGSGSSIDVTDTGVSAISGVVIAPTISLSAANSIDLSGLIDASTELALGSGGAISQTAGAITAGALDSIGDIGRNVSLTSARNAISSIGDVRLNGVFKLTNNAPLSIDGTLAASTVSIYETGQLALADKGALSITSSSTISSTSILEDGTFFVNAGRSDPTGNGLNATLYLYTNGANQNTSGPITFTPAPNGPPAPDIGLVAPDIDLVIGAGPGGVVTGNVNLRYLEITSAKSVNLTGFLKTKAGVSVTGPAAAANGSVIPTPLPVYKINNCPIESVNCVILPTAIVPVTNPLGNFDLSQRQRKRLYRNVQMPGIATRDY